MRCECPFLGLIGEAACQLPDQRDRKTSNGVKGGSCPEELLCPGPFSAFIWLRAEESSLHSGSGPGMIWVQIPAPLPTGCVISGRLFNFPASLRFPISDTWANAVIAGAEGTFGLNNRYCASLGVSAQYMEVVLIIFRIQRSSSTRDLKRISHVI